ncbi:hypothetical protein HY484_03745 [Candidatus Woesearchaeota archaeon]|nr:hypothetical protein [Candidatus Woesearchaeota archaeon]
MTRQKTMEIFTGSLESLERMTGKNYEAMKIDGKLVDVIGLGCKCTSHGRDVDDALQRMALGKGADAVVEVTYHPLSMNLSIGLSESNFPGRDQAYNIIFFARGYCVKDVSDEHPVSEGDADIDV